MDNINNSVYKALYEMINTKCLNACDKINKIYPTFEKDIQNASWMRCWKINNPNASEQEMISHAFTMMIMTHLMLGYIE